MIPGDFPPPDTILMQRLMPDGTINEIELLVMGTVRLCVGRPVGEYTYRDAY